jgi:hypothetical protein
MVSAGEPGRVGKYKVTYRRAGSEFILIGWLAGPEQETQSEHSGDSAMHHRISAETRFCRRAAVVHANRKKGVIKREESFAKAANPLYKSGF